MLSKPCTAGDVRACTTKFTETLLSPSNINKDIKLKIYDAPRLGEDEETDEKYLEEYREKLKECDVILWIMTSRNRTTALDQHYLKKLMDFKKKIIFGINQVDLTEPLNWDDVINLPSKEQKKNINFIVEDRKVRLEKVLKESVEMIPYSARKKYNLQTLFLDLIKKLHLIEYGYLKS